MKTSNNSTKLKSWEKFEVEACKYLNNIYNDSTVSFHQEGGKSSTTSDIKVYNDEKYLFSIEAKYSPSQSGQFVVIEENEHYSLSKESRFNDNRYTQKIIDYLNENKAVYSPLGQSSININLHKDILANWIAEHYIAKDSHFIITSTKLGGYKSILHVDEINKFFDASAVIRRKKSGSSHLPQSRYDDCIKILEEYTNKLGLKIIEKIKVDGKVLVIFNKNVKLKRSKRYFGDNYFLSPNSKGEGYYIKVLSSTNSLTVIFSLDYTGPEKNRIPDSMQRLIQSYLSD